MTEDCVNKGAPRARDRPRFSGINFGDQLLREGGFALLDPHGQMFSARLCCLHTPRAPGTSPASDRVCFLSPVGMVVNRVPPRFTLEQRSRRARLALRRRLVGKICHSTLRCWGEGVPVVGGNAGIALTTMRIRTIGLHLGWRTGLDRLCAMVMAVGAQD